MTFVDLHGHTTYSFLDGFGTPKQLTKRLKSLGRTACAITDHGNIIGHCDYEKNLTAAGIKPIFGCEFYVVDDMTDKSSRYVASLGVDTNPHVTVVAMNQTGYANLTKLSTLSYSEGFYHKPRIDWKTLARYQDGLCVLSGCVGGFPSRLILGKGAEAAFDFVRERVSQIEHYYVELIPVPGLGISMQTFPLLMDIARDLNVPWVMTSDPHFPAPEDHIAEDTLVAIGMRTTVDDPNRKVKLASFHYYCTDQELMDRARDTMFGLWTPERERECQEAMDNSGLIADMCNVEIPKAKPMLYPGADIHPGGAAAMLWSWIEEGIQFRVKQGKLPPSRKQEYLERATMEFELLRDKDFCDYILALADICRWAKAQDTLVMCRGSAGGCLILWLIGASETDSIFLDLDFNRFMDVTRNDPPDIDVDFEISMKERVYEYIANKYGKEKVCQILALSLVRARVAVQDVASAHGIPREEYSALSARLDSKDDDVDKQIEGTDDPLALAVLEKYPIFRMIDQIVGQARNSTIHAAGVLISSEPLSGQIAIMEQPGKPRVSSVDKHGAAYLNYLKLDLLMVSAYDVLADAVRKIGANMSWLYSLPYDDPAVYKLAQSGRVAGVFQLDGAAIKVGHQIRLDVFEELIAASALCRPGAMEHVPTYRQNKFDQRVFNTYMSNVHPIAQKNVAKTYGILIYQEQVMRMCNQMGNMPMSQVHKLRKRIANASFHGFALGAEYGDVFFAGCEANGVTKTEADYWWHAIKAHGIYSFNRAHAATYAIVGYWMLYMKAHYPDAYFESYLKHEGISNSHNQLLMKRLVADYRKQGGRIVLLDPRTSKKSFHSPEPGTIVGGWANIIGIGAAQADSIVKGGPYRDWEHVRSKLPAGLYYKLHEAGITGQVTFDQQAVTELAPWMPIIHMGDEEKSLCDTYRIASPSALVPNESSHGNVIVCGYVCVRYIQARTGTFKGERIIYSVEDEDGAAEWRVSYKQTELAAKVKANVKRGDFITVEGWWSGEQLFIKDFRVLKRR